MYAICCKIFGIFVLHNCGMHLVRSLLHGQQAVFGIHNFDGYIIKYSIYVHMHGCYSPAAEKKSVLREFCSAWCCFCMSMKLHVPQS